MKSKIFLSILILTLMILSVSGAKPDYPPAHGITGDLVTITADGLNLEIQTFRLNPAGIKIPTILTDNLQTSILKTSAHNRKITWWMTRGASFKGIANVLTSDVKIVQQSATRLVFIGTSYYFDFQDYVDAGFIVDLIFSGDYEVQLNIYKGSYNSEVVEFDPVFGSNVNTLYLEFDVCHPDWSCDTYGSCEINDTKYCITSIDANICGIAFDGNWSDVSAYEDTCNYCDQTWTADYSACINKEITLTYSFDNICCTVTNLTSDCIVPGDNGTTTDCYIETYTAGDYDDIIFDGLGRTGSAIVSWIIVLVLFLIIGWVSYQFRKNK